MEEGLLKATGKRLDHWIKVVKDSGISKHKEMINFLKEQHNFTYGFANFVAHKAKKSDAASHNDEDLVTTQYTGKESLLPIYESLKTFMTNLGEDVTITPKKSSVSFIRKRQFALVKPATKTRIDLGLKIKDRALEGRLEGSGPFGTMCTHRVKIMSTEEIDQSLQAWIREAYQQSV